MENLVWWQYLAAAWVTTWYLILLRTWKPIRYLLEDELPEHPMVIHRFLHWVVYAICINFLLPIVGLPICLSDDYRRRWVHGYIKGIVERNE